MKCLTRDVFPSISSSKSLARAEALEVRGHQQVPERRRGLYKWEVNKGTNQRTQGPKRERVPTTAFRNLPFEDTRRGAAYIHRKTKINVTTRSQLRDSCGLENFYPSPSPKKIVVSPQSLPSSPEPASEPPKGTHSTLKDENLLWTTVW